MPYAGPKWWKGFLRRNPALTVKKCTITCDSRMVHFTRENIETFFQRYEGILRDNHTLNGSELTDPSSLLGFDEVGMGGLPNTDTFDVVAIKGERARVPSSPSVPHITLAPLIAANGTLLGVYYIISTKCKFKDEFMDYVVEKHHKCCFNEHGSMTKEVFNEFVHWADEIVPSSTKRPVVIMCDNHVSRYNLHAIEYAVTRDMIIGTFCSGNTGYQQPQDAVIFRVFRGHYESLKKEFNEHMLQQPNSSFVVI